MIENKPLRSLNILTPDFKKKVDAMEGGDIKEFIVTPSHDGVTLEQAQEEALLWIRNRIEGKCVVSDRYEETMSTKTLSEFLEELK